MSPIVFRILSHNWESLFYLQIRQRVFCFLFLHIFFHGKNRLVVIICLPLCIKTTFNNTSRTTIRSISTRRICFYFCLHRVAVFGHRYPWQMTMTCDVTLDIMLSRLVVVLVYVCQWSYNMTTAIVVVRHACCP